MVDNENYKKKVQNTVDIISGRLIEISDWLYENPEYGCEEFEASSLLSSELKKHKFKVEKPFLGMPTAFKGTFRGRTSGPKVAILGEYDALEGVGHGCGHNIIGTAAIGAGIALSKIMKDLKGEIIVLGCPAEENRKGGPSSGWPCQWSKRIMCANGVFDDIDAAIMIHPTTGLTRVAQTTLISQYIHVTFKGKSAHAAADPWTGRNAMQAAVLFINGVNAMRQQLRRGKPYIPVSHWIISEAGTAGNVIPEVARCYGAVRSQDKNYLKEMVEMVHNCAKGAALMTGCELEWIPKPYPGEEPEVLTPNYYLAELMYKNFLELGVETEDWRVTARRQPGGGTDFGNVTRRVPGLHPHVSISKEYIPWHSVVSAKATTSEGGHRALINGAKALAMTSVDLFTVPKYLEKMKAVHLMDVNEYLQKIEEIGYARA